MTVTRRICAQDGLERGTLAKVVIVILDQSAHAVEKHALDIRVGAFRHCPFRHASGRMQQFTADCDTGCWSSFCTSDRMCVVCTAAGAGQGAADEPPRAGGSPAQRAAQAAVHERHPAAAASRCTAHFEHTRRTLPPHDVRDADAT